MTDDMITQIVIGLPNFAGFSIALLLMYRSLSQQQANNREIVDRLIDCWQEHMNKNDAQD